MKSITIYATAERVGSAAGINSNIYLTKQYSQTYNKLYIFPHSNRAM